MCVCVCSFVFFPVCPSGVLPELVTPDLRSADQGCEVSVNRLRGPSVTAERTLLFKNHRLLEGFNPSEDKRIPKRSRLATAGTDTLETNDKTLR